MLLCSFIFQSVFTPNWLPSPPLLYKVTNNLHVVKFGGRLSVILTFQQHLTRFPLNFPKKLPYFGIQYATVVFHPHAWNTF